MKKKAFAALLIAGCLFFSGCRSLPVSFRSGRSYMMTCGQETMSEAEVRLIALQYKCRFESFYKDLLGEDFWQEEVSDGIDFEAYVKEYFVYRECKALLYLSALARSDGLKPDEIYDQDFKEAAETFMASLSRDEQRYTGADADDVETLLRRYATASLEIEKALSGNDPEVSEEESRVADIQLIRVDDRKLAEELYERILNGESFLTLAQENTLDSRIDYSVYKGELLPELDELVFGMEDYEISRVMEVRGNYYIVRLVNSYDVLLSMNHKNNLAAEKRFLAWESLYDEQERKLTISRNGRAYDRISLSRTGDFPKVDLFSLIPEIG